MNKPKLTRRTPHGVRGLKFACCRANSLSTGSHSARSAWIEISNAFNIFSILFGRTPHGVRGLKFVNPYKNSTETCRTPHGVRG